MLVFNRFYRAKLVFVYRAIALATAGFRLSLSRLAGRQCIPVRLN